VRLTVSWYTGKQNYLFLQGSEFWESGIQVPFANHSPPLRGSLQGQSTHAVTEAQVTVTKAQATVTGNHFQ